MTVGQIDLLQGTLQLVVLKALLGGPLHGYAIARWVDSTTAAVLQVEDGSLYPALRRLEDRGFITARWGLSENNRRARYYELTAAGRRHLRSEAARWLEYSGAVTQVLRAAPSLA
jgi:transcriptional regulator